MVGMTGRLTTPATITERAREAWFLVEAAELRGLPMPRIVSASDYDRTRLHVDSPDEVTTWAEALDVDVDLAVDDAGNTHWTAEGELHESPVRVVFVDLVKASS